MKHVEAAGVRVSAIGLGCWQFGSRDWGYGKAYGDVTAVELVHTALDLGVNLIDTAEVYARGVSEAIVGRALEGRRAEAFLATKVTPTLPTADRVEEHGRLSAMRLGVDVIDLYQVHWPNPVVPVSATMDGMRRLQTAVSCGTSGSATSRRNAGRALRPRSGVRCCRTRCSTACCTAGRISTTCRTRRRTTA